MQNLRRSRLSALPACAGLCALVLGTGPNADADILKDIGAFFGKPLGGFVEAIAAPTIQSGESTARRLVADVDARVAGRIEQVNRVATGLVQTGNQAAKERIAQVDAVAEARMSQADNIMAARIAQVDAAADARIAQALGGLRSIEKEALNGALGAVDKLDDVAKTRIEQANAVVEARISQVNGTVQGAIAQADQDLQARIQQLDEVAERRLGSVDTMATKLALNLQITLLKVGALIGMVAFVVVALQYLFKHVPVSQKQLAEDKPEWSTGRRAAMTAATSAGWLGVHLVAGALAVALLGFLAYRLPFGARQQILDMTAVQERALKDSYGALDFSRVQYHAAQLAVLDPDHELQHRALEQKAELVRTAFMRPGLLTSPEGVRQLAQQISAAERVHEAAEAARDQVGNKAELAARQQADEAFVRVEPRQKQEQALTRKSPDVLSVACYLKWQLAASRGDELGAVTLCARALALHQSLTPLRKLREGANASEPFLLAPLASHYLRLYLSRAPARYPEDAAYSLDSLQKLAQSAPDPSRFTAFSSAMKYDELVLALDRDSSARYLELLEAHVAVLKAKALLPKKAKAARKATDEQRALTAAKEKRTQCALRLIQRWSEFENALDRTPELIGTPLTLNALTLNDVPYSHALWFKANPDAETAPPAIEQEPDVAVRIGMAPIRITWVRKYLTTLSREVQELVGVQESQRFKADENATLEFEAAYVAYALASEQAPDAASLRERLATSAGSIGLYVEKAGAAPVPYGVTLLGEATASAAVAAAYDSSRLRLL